MSVINAIPMLLGGEGYEISRSVRLRSSASAFFSRTPASAATNGTKFTWSGWVKRGSLSNTYSCLFGADLGAGTSQLCFFDASGNLYFYSGAVLQRTSAAVFRDPSAWYHVVVVGDSTQATAVNRLVFYVNGIQQTWTGTDPTLNGTWHIGRQSTLQGIGFGVGSSATTYFDGYLTEVNFIDGQALTPSSFGETDSITGVWKPKKYAGTYGTNGFYLNFSDNSAATAAAIGKDSSGNGNNWTPNNISVTSGVTYDSMLDVPTPYADGGNGRGNYCTWNPLSARTTTLTNGNLAASTTTGMCAGTIAVSSGKWYWECTPTDTSAQQLFGIISASNTAFPTYPGQTSDSYGYYAFNGNKYTGGTATAYGAAYGNNDVIGVALDLDAGTLVFYKNGTSQGTAYSGLSGTFMPAAGDGATNAWVGNFGQRPFAYTPPTGFKALNTQNLPAGSITTSGSFTGNASADGPFVYLNGVPTAMTINGNAVTFATHVDKTANGFKLRTSSSSYNASGSNTYSITTTGAKFKYANAQGNP